MKIKSLKIICTRDDENVCASVVEILNIILMELCSKYPALDFLVPIERHCSFPLYKVTQSENTLIARPTFSPTHTSESIHTHKH